MKKMAKARLESVRSWRRFAVRLTALERDPTDWAENVWLRGIAEVSLIFVFKFRAVSLKFRRITTHPPQRVEIKIVKCEKTWPGAAIWGLLHPTTQIRHPIAGLTGEG
jgi:hypothetical protein